VALLVLVALLRARSLTRGGQPSGAVVLVGCATLAASPVSWTHHQFWTVLAGMLLIGGGAGLRRAVGWALIGAMTVNLADLVGHAHLGDHAVFLAANTRALAACVLCVVGLSVVSRDRIQAAGTAGRWRPALTGVGTLGVALLVFALVPVPSTQDPLIRPELPTDAVTEALHDGPPCATEGQPHCTFIPMYPGLAINYGTHRTASGNEIAGFASEYVTRLVYPPPPEQTPSTSRWDGSRQRPVSKPSRYASATPRSPSSRPTTTPAPSLEISAPNSAPDPTAAALRSIGHAKLTIS